MRNTQPNQSYEREGERKTKNQYTLTRTHSSANHTKRTNHMSERARGQTLHYSHKRSTVQRTQACNFKHREEQFTAPLIHTSTVYSTIATTKRLPATSRSPLHPYHIIRTERDKKRDAILHSANIPHDRSSCSIQTKLQFCTNRKRMKE